MPRVIRESIARPEYFTFMSPRYINSVAIECDANYCFQNLTNRVYTATGLNVFVYFFSSRHIYMQGFCSLNNNTIH